MRGKLRDKRIENQRNRFKRELVERRRPAKRQNRASFLFNQQLEWEEDYQFDSGEELLIAAKKFSK